MSGGKGAWEHAASSVDARLTRAAGSIVEGVARTRVVSACLVAAICFCLAFSAACVAWDTLFLGFLLDFDLLLHHQYQQNLQDSSASHSLPFCVSSSFSLSLCHVKSSRQEKRIKI